VAFVGLDRGIVDHWIYQDAEYFKVWFEMLYRARYSTDPEKKLIEGLLVNVEYGQFIFGRNSWSQRLNVSERRMRTLIDKLLKDKMISLVHKYTKLTVYQVVNYELYNNAKTDQQNDQQESQSGQGESGDSDQQNDHRATSRRPAGDQQATTKEQGINKVNKGNKVKQEAIKEIYAEMVSLSKDEHEKLIIKYGSEESAKWGIEKLSAYKCSKKTKYVSDYHVLIGWVFDEFEKKKLTVINGNGNRGKVSSFERIQQLAREEQEREASGHY
jgi:hypothetical protein